jgi:hypothetical protein
MEGVIGDLEIKRPRHMGNGGLFAVTAIVIPDLAVSIAVAVNILIRFHGFGADHSSGIPSRSSAANVIQLQSIPNHARVDPYRLRHAPVPDHFVEERQRNANICSSLHAREAARFKARRQHVMTISHTSPRRTRGRPLPTSSSATDPTCVCAWSHQVQAQFRSTDHRIS